VNESAQHLSRKQNILLNFYDRLHQFAGLGFEQHEEQNVQDAEHEGYDCPHDAEYGKITRAAVPTEICGVTRNRQTQNELNGIHQTFLRGNRELLLRWRGLKSFSQEECVHYMIVYHNIIFTIKAS
jgi:hypothetical protein